MLRLVLLLAFASFRLFAEEPALVKATDTWRYQTVTGESTGSQPPWNSLNYDDSNWLSGVANFGTYGASLGGWREVTLLDPQAVAYTFRKKFNITDPEFIRSLILRIDYQHGFVAYLNGNEITRRSLPSSNSVPLTATSSYHLRGPTEFIDVSNGIPFLQPGTNVLAVQLHNTGEDIDFLLAAELLANFSRGPFVQNASRTSIQIIWKTVDATTGFVLYGKDQSQLLTALSPIKTNTHALTLTNLEPGQQYFYRVFSERIGDLAASDWTTFRTLKPPGAPIRFQVFGDTGQLTPGQYNIAKQMAGAPTDLVVHCGDVLYPCFTTSQVDLRCFSIYRDQMRSVPYYFLMGNHDGYCGLADYQEAFYLPTNKVTRTEEYYSFDHGDVHFVILATDVQNGQDYRLGTPQYNWLQNDLATSTQSWKFIFFHHVIRSSSYHSADDWLIDGILDKYVIQTFIGGLAERYNAQIIFNGHDHDYERFASFNGVNSYISGGGGASLYGQDHLEQGSVQFFMRHHFLDVTINGSELMVEAVDENGAVLDRFHRSQTSSTTHNSQWGSPDVEATAGSDATGNILGQTFGFSGPSLATRAGLWGNLGRIHVRNDGFFVYLGLEQAVLHDNQVIALFLENPAAPGVADIAPLGNNQMDGDMDGLDLLGKLAFKNFQPSIACLLGDELADANLRNFKRPQMRWATGQGVFRLDQNFTSIPGARLQQFNRNPQESPKFAESNADFIEVAIPLDALAYPTNSLRLGAIIFSDPIEGPMEPQIDTALAGKSLEPRDGRYFLEPLTIQLAPNPDPDPLQFRGTRMANSQIQFTWNSTPGVKYWIQYTTNLAQPFLDFPVGLPYTATTTRSSFDLPVGPNSPQFFRLRWE
jgi:hypothetical protein